jgi:hypothetical protein
VRTLVPGIVAAALIGTLAYVLAPERLHAGDAPRSARSEPRPPSAAFARAAIRARYGGVSDLRFLGPTTAGGHSPAFAFGARVVPYGSGQAQRVADIRRPRSPFVFYRDATGKWTLL